MIDTFSANSLKILEVSIEEFEKKYIKGKELLNVCEEAKIGNKFHKLIYYFLKKFEIEKFENSINEKEINIWNELKHSEIMNFIQNSDEIFVEYPFFIKEDLNGKNFYLTGRFDCVVKNDNQYTIIDWKINNLPKNPECDIQTIVYFEAISKLFKTQNINMIYFSIKNQNSTTVTKNPIGLDKIKKLISELFLYCKNQNK